MIPLLAVLCAAVGFGGTSRSAAADTVGPVRLAANSGDALGRILGEGLRVYADRQSRDRDDGDRYSSRRDREYDDDNWRDRDRNYGRGGAELRDRLIDMKERLRVMKSREERRRDEWKAWYKVEARRSGSESHLRRERAREEERRAAWERRYRAQEREFERLKDYYNEHFK